MPPKRILIIQGHPDPSETHLCHALADAYVVGAHESAHHVDVLKVAELNFPLLRMESDFNEGEPNGTIKLAQAKILQADHLVIIYPLWLGTVPALLQGFFEQVFRPQFAFAYSDSGVPHKRLEGRSARVVVTMGMPAPAYLFWYRAHSLKSLERNLLNFCGVSPVRAFLCGNAKGASERTRERWLTRMQTAGRRAQ